MMGGRASRHCISFGVPFALSADSGDVMSQMLACVPLGTVSGDSPDDGREFALMTAGGGEYRLKAGEEVIAEGASLEAILEVLARELMVHVAEYAPDRVFLHAGVVGWQGGALVLPGTSFAGKTTLVAELVRAGATYYSDEYAVLDERGWVHPYPRELHMRRAGGVEQRGVAVEELGGRAGGEPLRVTRVVFAEYVEGGRWRPEPVSAGMAALEMLRHTIPVQRTPARVMATLAKMMETATAVRSERGDAGETARLLLDTGG